jgi:hypothetical protein
MGSSREVHLKFIIYSILIVMLLTAIAYSYIFIEKYRIENLYHEYKNQKSYFIYDTSSQEVLKAPFVKKDLEFGLLKTRETNNWLPYDHKFWIIDTINQNYVEFIGIRQDCWGFVRGFALKKSVMEVEPSEELLKTRREMEERNSKLNLPKKKTDCYGSIYGFYCTCDN